MSTARILTGDALEMLKTLPDESVHCCVTSPPYWGLRDYGVDGQLGLEETPEEYVENLVEVFREVRRVLRDDGTLWLNLGDSYTSGGRSSRDPGQSKLHPAFDGDDSAVTRWRPGDPPGLKPKDLVGIPWRVAFALQADGWWLRSDIIWSKPNPMPESVTDRPTKAHEYVFLLSKSERYYYDHVAVAEKADKGNAGSRFHTGKTGAHQLGRASDEPRQGSPTRNRRTVWEITTKPYPSAHFAVYPPALIEPCIQSGTSEKGACVECGDPWERVVEVERNRDRPRAIETHAANANETPQGGYRGTKETQTTGWQPTCDCDTDDVVPCTVLDPFAGSGTTGSIATGHNRDAILIDLNPDYVEMMKERIGPMFVEAA